MPFRMMQDVSTLCMAVEEPYLMHGWVSSRASSRDGVWISHINNQCPTQNESTRVRLNTHVPNLNSAPAKFHNARKKP